MRKRARLRLRARARVTTAQARRGRGAAGSTRRWWSSAWWPWTETTSRASTPSASSAPSGRQSSPSARARLPVWPCLSPPVSPSPSLPLPRVLSARSLARSLARSRSPTNSLPDKPHCHTLARTLGRPVRTGLRVLHVCRRERHRETERERAGGFCTCAVGGPPSLQGPAGRAGACRRLGY